MDTFTELDNCCVGCLTSKPEFSPVGVEDTSSGNSCSYAPTHPSIHRVSEPLHTKLFCGWTHEQLNDAQLTDPDISPEPYILGYTGLWYSMKDDVTFWCRTCTSCAAKARPKKTPQAGHSASWCSHGEDRG